MGGVGEKRLPPAQPASLRLRMRVTRLPSWAPALHFPPHLLYQGEGIRKAWEEVGEYRLTRTRVGGMRSCYYMRRLVTKKRKDNLSREQTRANEKEWPTAKLSRWSEWPQDAVTTW